MARKQLNADVRAFLKGDNVLEELEPVSEAKNAEVEADIEKTTQTEQVDDGGLLADILGPNQQSEAIVRYTADLPESLHQRLSYAAVKNKTTKIKLLRQVLDKVLPQLPT
ncbi:MAG: hypothetical protein WA949_19310 [Phormidesmis sp.]